MSVSSQKSLLVKFQSAVVVTDVHCHLCVTDMTLHLCVLLKVDSAVSGKRTSATRRPITLTDDVTENYPSNRQELGETKSRL